MVCLAFSEEILGITKMSCALGVRFLRLAGLPVYLSQVSCPILVCAPITLFCMLFGFIIIFFLSAPFFFFFFYFSIFFFSILFLLPCQRHLAVTYSCVIFGLIPFWQLLWNVFMLSCNSKLYAWCSNKSCDHGTILLSAKVKHCYNLHAYSMSFLSGLWPSGFGNSWQD